MAKGRAVRRGPSFVQGGIFGLVFQGRRNALGARFALASAASPLGLRSRDTALASASPMFP